MARHDDAYVPSFKTIIVPCCGCKTGIEVGNRRTRPARCVECSTTAFRDAIKSLQEKNGAVYERWREGITRGIEALPRG